MKRIQSILIANRGEIASRIRRTCRKMGIRSIAIFSEVDRNAPFVRNADMAIFIGGSTPTQSYLDIEIIIAAAHKTGADAIHPGYGFLSENVAFAERCAQEGLIFIGPNPNAIQEMGSKSNAKRLMNQHGVPILPGYQGKDQSIATLNQAALEIGYPVLLKATAGGGGKGMRIVEETAEIESAIAAAKREAKNAFGDDELIIEKYIASGRHIEFQIFGDQHGNIIHILERECTIQRRYQKVIEESPSPILSETIRQKMGAAAVKAAKALQYDNAGTVEFIFDESSGEFYFLEVNTRLQVEHPVTEEITGLDLVEMQIETAQGLPLSVQQKDIKGNGYALECRLYAEDPANDFLPVIGKIERFAFPAVDGIRIESAIESGSEISAFYDPMIAKIIVWDRNRPAVMRKMEYVLKNLVCLGITTNQSFLLHLLQNRAFQLGQYDTHFIKNKVDLNSFNSNDKEKEALAAIAVCLFNWKKREDQRTLLSAIPSGWRNSFYTYQKEVYWIDDIEKTIQYRLNKEGFEFLIEDEIFKVNYLELKENILRLEIEGLQYGFSIANKENRFFVHNEALGNIELKEKNRFPLKKIEKIKGNYETPMPSQIIKILVTVGQMVEAGEDLVVLSSMKMENTITANEAGIIEEIFVAEGNNVEAGVLLLKIGVKEFK